MAIQATHPEHAGQLRGQPERRPRHLRTGFVDGQPSDDELRRALGVLRVGRFRKRRRRQGRFVGGPDASDRSTCRPGRASRRAAASVYDLFGNQKTALKFSIGKFMQQAGTTGFSNRYNPLALRRANVSWTDLNNDGVPQGELRLRLPDAPGARSTSRQLPTDFGVASICRPSIRTSSGCTTSRRRVSIQHEICTRRVGDRRWYHRHYQEHVAPHQHGSTFADFTPFTVFSPIDGSRRSPTTT